MPSIPPPVRSRPVHPAQLYSAIDAGLLAWLLWAFYPFRRRDGEVVALMMTIHPITRFLLEMIRIDEPAGFRHGAQHFAEYQRGISACAAGLWWYLSKQSAANRLALDGVETDCGSPRVRTGHFRDQWGNA